MGNSIQNNNFKLTPECFNCIQNTDHKIDFNELKIYDNVNRAKGKITEKSIAYLSINEKKFFKAIILFYFKNS